MSVLPFRLREIPRVETRLSAALTEDAEQGRFTLALPDGWLPGIAVRLPTWVIEAGYRPIAHEIPRVGELFFDRKRDRVLRCAEVETQKFVILEYGPKLELPPADLGGPP
jgi:hypothetical protein